MYSLKTGDFQNFDCLMVGEGCISASPFFSPLFTPLLRKLCIKYHRKKIIHRTHYTSAYKVTTQWIRVVQIVKFNIIEIMAGYSNNDSADLINFVIFQFILKSVPQLDIHFCLKLFNSKIQINSRTKLQCFEVYEGGIVYRKQNARVERQFLRKI